MGEPEHVPSLNGIKAGSTIGALFRNTGLDPVEARILAAHVLGLSRVQLITRDAALLDEEQAGRVREAFLRRLRGEPIAYIVEEREFYGLPFAVTPDVLIPRPETELLVELALERLPQNGRALDLGTGSGAIAVALAHARPDATVLATDISEAALSVARRNARRHRTSVSFRRSNWHDAVSDIVHVIVANPPYIASGDIHLMQGDLRFEPPDALTDHADGLSALRTIIGGAPAHLFPGGWLLMEHGYDQAEDVRDLLHAQGFVQVQSWHDLAGIERVSGGRVA